METGEESFFETGQMMFFVKLLLFVSRLSEEDLALVKSFEDKDGMIEYQRFLETIVKL